MGSRTFAPKQASEVRFQGKPEEEKTRFISKQSFAPKQASEEKSQGKPRAIQAIKNWTMNKVPHKKSRFKAVAPIYYT